MSHPERQAVGALLAGGRGSRIGGDKAVVRLGGRPLIDHPLAALRAVVDEIVVVAKPDTLLPAPEALDGARILREPALPRHPLVGVVHALSAAGGRAVLVCAADMPFVSVAALSELLAADAGDAPAVIAAGPGGRLQPLLGVYRPRAAGLLAQAARAGTAPVRAAVAAIAPRVVQVGDPEVLFNVNSAEDLARAEAMIASRT